MIVGGYVLDLYCDARGCTSHKRVGHEDHRRAALVAARTSGWTVNTSTGFVRCPSHKHYRPHITNAEFRSKLAADQGEPDDL